MEDIDQSEIEWVDEEKETTDTDDSIEQERKVTEKEFFECTSPTMILINGPTESGKSVLFLWWLYHNRSRFDEVIIFCPTFAHNKTYSSTFPQSSIIVDPKKEDIQRVLDEADATPYLKRLLIFDDIVGCKKIGRSEELGKIATGGRHTNLSCAILTQHLHSIAPEIRSQIRAMYITGVSPNDLETVWGLQLSSRFDTKRQLKRFLDENVKDYQFVRFNTTMKGDREPIVFKPGMAPKMRFRSFRER